LVARRAWTHGPAGGRARARGTHTTKGGGAKSHGLPPGGSNSHDWAGPLFLFCSHKPRQGFVQERDNREAPKWDHYNTHLTTRVRVVVTNSLAPKRARKPCHARRSLPMEREPCCVSNQQHGAVCATSAKEAPALDGTHVGVPAGRAHLHAKTNQRLAALWHRLRWLEWSASHEPDDDGESKVSGPGERRSFYVPRSQRARDKLGEPGRFAPRVLAGETCPGLEDEQARSNARRIGVSSGVSSNPCTQRQSARSPAGPAELT